jgi:hypothetical protein
MRAKFQLIVTTLLCLLATSVFAAKDPVSWRLDSPFHNPIYTGRTYSVTYTFTSQLPVTMRKALVIKKVATPADDFTYNDQCSGLKLAPRQSCTVQITAAPTIPGTASVQLGISGYDDNLVWIPALSTEVTGRAIERQIIYTTITQGLPSSSSIGETQSYVISFTNRSESTVSNVAVSVAQTSGTANYTTSCGSTLASGKTCNVTGTYTPTSNNPSLQSVTVTMTYGDSKSVSATTSTSIPATTGFFGSFVGYDYLPAEMVGGAANQKTIWVLYTYNGAGTATVTTAPTPMTATVGGSIVTLTEVFNHCNGASLNGSQSAGCDIQYTFAADTVGTPTAVTVRSRVSYSTGGPSTDSDVFTSTEVVPSMGTSRTITLVNNCTFPVWFSLNGGQLNGSPTCTSNAQCPTGTACSSLTNKCYWNNIAPTSAAPGGTTLYELPQGGGTNTVTVPLTSADPTVQWSGNISASTGCNNTSSCTQASCSNAGGSTACAPGQGFSQPATEAEITMNISTSDSYDVEVINGYHIPISMTPGSYTSPNNYNCGIPGASSAGNGFGACNWQNASPPGNGYYWVTSGGASCNISSPSCSSNLQICGLDSSLNQVCGNFLGYWTADQVCSMNSIPAAVSSYFSCTTPLSSLTTSIPFPANSTLYDLMACSVPKNDPSPTFNSCYLTYSGSSSSQISQCCGCIDWWTLGIGANQNTQSCTPAGTSTAQTDAVWNSYLQNGLAWLKTTCPSVYTYPFDDKTSGFSCTNTIPGESNSLDYTITFCSGNSGAPAGKTDGR